MKPADLRRLSLSRRSPLQEMAIWLMSILVSHWWGGFYRSDSFRCGQSISGCLLRTVDASTISHTIASGVTQPENRQNLLKIPPILRMRCPTCLLLHDGTRYHPEVGFPSEPRPLRSGGCPRTIPVSRPSHTGQGGQFSLG